MADPSALVTLPRVAFCCTQRAAKIRNFVWFSLKMLRCRARGLPSLHGYALVGHFYSATYACAHGQYTWCTSPFCEKTSGACELLLIMPPSKVCPQCQAVVPPRLKVCKSCDKAELNLPDQATSIRASETSEQTTVQYCAEGFALQCSSYMMGPVML